MAMIRKPSDVARASTLKADLQRPCAYGSTIATDEVELVETHASWVFLLNRDVFKERP